MKRYLLFFFLLISVSIIEFKNVTNIFANSNIKRNYVRVAIPLFFIDPSDAVFPCGKQIQLNKEIQIKLNGISEKLEQLNNDNYYTDFHNATLSCILGNKNKALNYYLDGAKRGDSWQAVQAFLIYSEFDDESAKRILSESNLSANELYDYYVLFDKKYSNTNHILLGEYAIISEPLNLVSWKLLLSICRSNQIRSGKENYLKILACYDRIINSSNGLSDIDLSLVYLYRGEIKRSLYPNFSPNEVLSDYLRASKLDPKNNWINLAISIVYLWDLENFEKTKLYIEKIFEINSSWAEAYLLLGDFYKRQGNYDKALEAYESALYYNQRWKIANDRILELLRKK